MLFENETMLEAYTAGGYRERYAMTHGKYERIWKNGHAYLKFTLDPGIRYPEADGVVFDLQKRKWINEEKRRKL